MGADFFAKVWDAVSGEELHSFQHEHIVKCVAFSPDGSSLATGSNEKLLRVFDLKNPNSDPFVISGHTSGLRHISFLGNGEQIVSCADDRTVRFWDCSTGKEIHRLDFNSVPNGIEVSHDNTILTVACGSTVSFWDTSSYEKIKEFPVPSLVHSASLHAEEKTLKCIRWIIQQDRSSSHLKDTLDQCIVYVFRRTENFTLPDQKMEHYDCGRLLSEKRTAYGNAPIRMLPIFLPQSKLKG